jgi:hypothetical protein
MHTSPRIRAWSAAAGLLVLLMGLATVALDRPSAEAAPAPCPSTTTRSLPSPTVTRLPCLPQLICPAGNCSAAVFGRAAIPRSRAAVVLDHPGLSAASRIFLTVDNETDQPGGTAGALPGVRVDRRADHTATVGTLDRSVTANPAGVPFTWLAVNRATGTIGPLGFTAGSASVPAGRTDARVAIPAVKPDSTILLTVDASGTAAAGLPGLKVQAKADGAFVVTTLGLETAPPTGVPFTWLVLNRPAGATSDPHLGSARIAPGANRIGALTAAAVPGAGVLATVDVSAVAGASRVPGVKIDRQGTSFFEATTANLSAAPATGVPFGWLVVDPQPGDVWVDGVELTQGVQVGRNLGPQVPLIAGKRTFVRVYVAGRPDTRGALSGVTASLSVNGVTRAPVPGTPATVTASPTGSDRRTLTDSFLFELDATSIGAGARNVTVSISAPTGRRASGLPATTQTVPATFGPTGSRVDLHVYGVRYGYRDVPSVIGQPAGLTTPDWPARSQAAFEPLRVTAESALPVAKLFVDPIPSQGSAVIDCAPQQVDGVWSCSGYLQGREFAQNVIDAQCPTGGCWIAVLQPEIDLGHHGAHWTTPKGNHAINLQGEAQPVEMGLTLAHEIGHGLGLPHTFDPGTDYPRAGGGLGPFVGLRYSPGVSLVPGQDASGRTTAYDLMSYNSPAWFSPYNYCKAMPTATSGRLSCPPGLAG